MARKKLSAEEVAQRNQEVIGLLLADVPQVQVATQTGVSDRQVRRIWQDYVKGDRLNPRDEDPARFVASSIEQLRALRSVLAARLGSAENTAALTGAVRAMADLLGREIELRQAVGYLPRRLGDLRVKFDVEYVAKVLFQVLEEHEVPAKVYEELAERFQEATGGMTMSAN